MQGVIMAGGFGTRLRPLTCNIPKPMIPLANKPIMEHIINLLKKNEITDLIVLLYFQADKIVDYFKDGKKFGVNITYVKPEGDLGTAGAVKYASQYLNDRFIVISADLATDFDLQEGIDFHIKKKGEFTIFLTSVENPLQYGVIILDKSGKITRFLEKPTWGEVFSDLINTGIYIAEPHILNEIPDDTEFDFSKNLFPNLLEKGVNLLGYNAKGYWRDVGNLTEYLDAHYDSLQGKYKIESISPNENIIIGKNAKIDPDVIFEGKVRIGSNCTIKKNTIIRNTFIGDNTEIGSNTKILRSIIWDNVSIGNGVSLTGDVITSNTTIKNGAYIFEKVFIGENCVVEEESKITSNVKIWPDKVVERKSVLSTSLIWGERWISNIFSEARVTGIGNVELSPEFSAKLASAFGALLGKGSTAVTSRDSSDASRMIKRAMISGLMSSGVNVEDLRITPISVVRHNLRSGHYKGGLHIRSSPRGEKLFNIIFFDADGRDISTSKAKSIERLFFNEDYLRAKVPDIGRLTYSIRAAESYLDYFFYCIDNDVFKKRKFRAVIDYSYGMATTILPAALGTLGIDVVSLNSYPDAAKIVRDKEGYIKSFRELSRIVKSLNADCGITVGPNGESIWVIDDKGRILSDSELQVMMTELFLTFHDCSKIAAPVNGSFLLEEIAQKRGVELVWCKSSHGSMMEAASQKGIGFVGGSKGGFIFTDFHFACDGMFAVAKFIEMILKSTISISKLYKRFPFPHLLEKTVSCRMEEKGKVMRGLMEDTESYEKILIDGIKINENGVSVLIIPDKEAPVFYVIGESYDKEKMMDAVEYWQKRVTYWRNL